MKKLLTKEIKGEEILLLILSIVAVILGLLLFAGILTINSESPVVGEHPDAFAWVITIAGVIGIFLSVYKISRSKEKKN